MKIIWLASWYPNKYEPVNGDFIQRHAKAVSNILPIDVLHVVQLGKNFEANNEIETINAKNLTEHICYFKFKKWGIGIIDKIRYNTLYKKTALAFVENFIKTNGKPDLIHVHVPMKSGWVAYSLKKKYSIPYIVSEQASYYDDEAPDNFKNRSLFFKLNTKKVCKNAIAISNVSSVIAKKMEKLLNVKNIHTIHNIANTKRFFYMPIQPQNEFIWVHVSTLSEQKNIPGIIYAFRQLVAENIQLCKLVLVGTYKELHEPLVKQLQLEHLINFTGEVTHHQVAGYLQSANAFVLFSKHENFPCVLVEALCCGLPVVATNVGGIPDAINDNNGLMVPSNNVVALTAAMKSVMMNYKNYNQAFIAERAKQLYDDEVIAKQFVALYENCLKDKV